MILLTDLMNYFELLVDKLQKNNDLKHCYIEDLLFQFLYKANLLDEGISQIIKVLLDGLNDKDNVCLILFIILN